MNASEKAISDAEDIMLEDDRFEREFAGTVTRTKRLKIEYMVNTFDAKPEAIARQLQLTTPQVEQVITELQSSFKFK